LKPANSLLSGLGTTIFTVMSALAVEHGAINLGQGFPDTDGPADILDAADAALRDGRNQYPPMPGVPELRQAVASANARFYGIEVEATREVIVTSGATEAMGPEFAYAVVVITETGRALKARPAGDLAA